MFREYAKEFFTNILNLVVDIKIINSFFNQLSLKNEWDENAAGWLLYYPTYILLHIIFIYVLFYNKTKIRNWLIFSLIGFVTIDFALIIVFKELDLYLLYKISYKMFQQLFGLPFILLAIEGGRHLFREILSSE